MARPAPRGGFWSGVLVMLALLALLFGVFLTFLWAAIDLGGGRDSAPSDFDEFWLAPIGLMALSFALALAALRYGRSRAAAATCAASLGLAIFLLAISPFF